MVLVLIEDCCLYVLEVVVYLEVVDDVEEKGQSRKLREDEAKLLLYVGVDHAGPEKVPEGKMKVPLRQKVPIEALLPFYRSCLVPIKQIRLRAEY